MPVLNETISRYRTTGFRINITTERKTELTVQATAESLEAVFGNLLENSRQAGATEIGIHILDYPGTVQVRIQDNGPGISEGNKAEIFTPFFTTRRVSGGTGLGLSITQSLLSRQGASIDLAPSEKGACFEITLRKA
jgi:signal transduction histidine kinase